MYNVDTKEIEAFLKSLHNDNELTDQALINLATGKFNSDNVLIPSYLQGVSDVNIRNHLKEYFKYELVNFEYSNGVFLLGSRYYEICFNREYFNDYKTIFSFQEVEPIEIKVIRYVPKQQNRIRLMNE